MRFLLLHLLQDSSHWWSNADIFWHQMLFNVQGLEVSWKSLNVLKMSHLSLSNPKWSDESLIDCDFQLNWKWCALENHWRLPHYNIFAEVGDEMLLLRLQSTGFFTLSKFRQSLASYSCEKRSWQLREIQAL